MHRFPLAVTLALLSTLTLCGPAMAQAAAPGADIYPKLPPGPGRDVVMRVCSQCHPPEIVTTKHMDLDGWNDLVGQMQVNGAEASDDDFDQIVNYLAASFSPQ